MMYVKVIDGNVEKYPYQVSELIRSNPQTSFPSEVPDSLLGEWGVFPVVREAPPLHDPIYQTPEETNPLYVGGQWVQAWAIRPATQQEIDSRIQNIQIEIVESTQQRLDSFAQERSYDGILSLCTYATSPTQKFADEGQYGITARDATWAKLYEILAEVQAGTRPMPSGYAAIEPELPPLVWP